MHRSEGFTLIELMITVALIAILLVFAIPSLQNARKSANETSAIAYLKMTTGVNMRYKMRFGAYPGDQNDLINVGMLDPDQNPNGYVVSFGSVPSGWSSIICVNVYLPTWSLTWSLPGTEMLSAS